MRSWVSAVTIEFPQDQLFALVTLLDRMVEEVEYIDASLHDLSPWHKFLALRQHLKERLVQGTPHIAISLTWNHFVAFQSYLGHADDLELDEEEELLATAMQKLIYDLRAEGKTPAGPFFV